MISLSSEIIVQVFYAAVIDVVIVYGILETARTLKASPINKTLARFLKVFLTYCAGYMSALFLPMDNRLQWIVMGFIIGCLATALYVSVAKSLFTLVPRVFDKIFGGGN